MLVRNKFTKKLVMFSIRTLSNVSTFLKTNDGEYQSHLVLKNGSDVKYYVNGKRVIDYYKLPIRII